MTYAKSLASLFTAALILTVCNPASAQNASSIDPEVYAVWGPQPATISEEPPEIRLQQAEGKDQVRKNPASPRIGVAAAQVNAATARLGTNSRNPQDLTARDSNSQYAGRPKKIPNSQWVSKDGWGDFISSWKELSAEGMRLVDIEYQPQVDKLARFHGLFVPGNDGYAFYGVNTIEELSFLVSDTTDGLEVVDFELIEGDETIQALVVLREGKRSQRLVRFKNFARIDTISQKFGRNGERVDDAEVFNDELFVVATKARGAFTIATASNYQALAPRWDKLSKEGFRLIDLEPYSGQGGLQGLLKRNAAPPVLAVFHKRDAGYALLGGTETLIRQKATDFEAGGLPLSDLEFYLSPGQLQAISDETQRLEEARAKAKELEDVYVKIRCYDESLTDQVSDSDGGQGFIFEATCAIEGPPEGRKCYWTKLKLYYTEKKCRGSNVYGPGLGASFATAKVEWDPSTRLVKEEIKLEGFLDLEILKTVKCRRNPFDKENSPPCLLENLLVNYSKVGFRPRDIEMDLLQSHAPISMRFWRAVF